MHSALNGAALWHADRLCTIKIVYRVKLNFIQVKKDFYLCFMPLGPGGTSCMVSAIAPTFTLADTIWIVRWAGSWVGYLHRYPDTRQVIKLCVAWKNLPCNVGRANLVWPKKCQNSGWLEIANLHCPSLKPWGVVAEHYICKSLSKALPFKYTLQ